MVAFFVYNEVMKNNDSKKDSFIPNPYDPLNEPWYQMHFSDAFPDTPVNRWFIWNALHNVDEPELEVEQTEVRRKNRITLEQMKDSAIEAYQNMIRRKVSEQRYSRQALIEMGAITRFDYDFTGKLIDGAGIDFRWQCTLRMMELVKKGLSKDEIKEKLKEEKYEIEDIYYALRYYDKHRDALIQAIVYLEDVVSLDELIDLLIHDGFEEEDIQFVCLTLDVDWEE